MEKEKLYKVGYVLFSALVFCELWVILWLLNL
jgi:hypothetical protein